MTIKVVTGDNELVSQKICTEVGLPTSIVILGSRSNMTEAELEETAERATLFARVSPAHKQRIIRAIQARKHTVGFMGDGINDAPALRTADVGISVDTAVDIAKESADMILLEKNLLVLEGVLEWSQGVMNILAIIAGQVVVLGNMFSVLGASVFVPYLPMMPIQILTNNLLYDVSQTAIPTDEVDPEQIARPRPWDMGSLARFIAFIGPCSSVFDYTTYLMMLFLFNCWSVERASLFQTGWFVESLLTQTLIIHVIRTNKIPFLQSRASWSLIVMSTVIMGIGVAIPCTRWPLRQGSTALPTLYWPLLALTLLCHVLTQVEDLDRSCATGSDAPSPPWQIGKPNAQLLRQCHDPHGRRDSAADRVSQASRCPGCQHELSTRRPSGHPLAFSRRHVACGLRRRALHRPRSQTRQSAARCRERAIASSGSSGQSSEAGRKTKPSTTDQECDYDHWIDDRECLRLDRHLSCRESCSPRCSRGAGSYEGLRPTRAQSQRQP